MTYVVIKGLFCVFKIAAKLGVGSEDVSNCIVWGNHSATQYPDVRHAKVNVGGTAQSVHDAVKDDAWLKNDFITVSSVIYFIPINDTPFKLNVFWRSDTVSKLLFSESVSHYLLK